MTPVILEIPIDQIIPDPGQPRRRFQDDELARMAASIKARGVLLPLRVRRDEERNVWILQSGECRWRGACLVPLPTVPCLPVEGELSEADLLADQLIENTVRHALRPMEHARALARLKTLKRATASALSAAYGFSNAAITRAEALLSLPEPIQTMVDAGAIPESAAYELSRLDDADAQRELADAIAGGRMTRDQAAEAVRDRLGRKPRAPKGSKLAVKAEGVAITLTAGEAFAWEPFLATLDRIRKEARQLRDSGGEFAALARVLKPT